tara:strand:+ start:163 stop:309 length:147 start_codon:yes stop_codon:yes gene_type:complete
MNYNIDKLITVANYAKLIKRTPQRVYQMRDEGEVRIVELDGVMFVEQE